MKKIIASFYKFVHLPDFQEKRAEILSQCESLGIKGTILLALEGINGTIAGAEESIQAVIDWLRQDSRFQDLEPLYAVSEDTPFERLKVKLKKEIVTMGKPEVDPTEQVGTYVTPREWNQLIQDPEVVVIDTRNSYEVDIGTFKRAQNPQTRSFREFPSYVEQNLDPAKQRKVALFCTGGIRCEKATSLLLQKGFEQVYHLKGGILRYLAEVDPQESLWEGECFVFDERVAIKEKLAPGSYDFCVGCGHPLAASDRDSDYYEEGICCPHCWEDLTPEKRSRQQARLLTKLQSQSQTIRNGN